MKCFQCILSLAIVVTALNAAMAQGPPQPTEEHKVLEQEVGTWNAKGKMWMPGSSEATEFEGVETNRSIGGMWIVSDFKGNFFGQPFEGHATMGYNLKTKKYVGRWMDNMSAYTSEMEGTYDADTKTLTMNSSGVDAATGNSTKGKNVVVPIPKLMTSTDVSYILPYQITL